MKLNQLLNEVDVELDLQDVQLDREALRQIALTRRVLRHTEENIMGRLDTISEALATARSTAAAEHEQVIADLQAAADAAAALQASVNALTANAVTDEEVTNVQSQAAALVEQIKGIDPDAIVVEEPPTETPAF